MKVRLGFVSNSSSSSFLIYGTTVDATGDYDKDSLQTDRFDSEGLESHIPPDSSFIYVGLSWSKVADEQTGKQFKEAIEAKLKSLGVQGEFQTLEGASWYDG